jgi:hypothetical protein
MYVDVSYASPQEHGIVNVALHGSILQVSYLFNPKGGSNSIISKTNTGITLASKIRLSKGYVKQV